MSRRPYIRFAFASLFSLVPALFVIGCAQSDPKGLPVLSVISGDKQTGTAGLPLAKPLVARVVNTEKGPVSGATVTFTVLAGGGHVSPATAVTSANGEAQTTLVLGDTAGENIVTARFSGALDISFVATGQAGVPFKMSLFGGDGQTADPGTAVAAPLVVLVADEFDNPVPGSLVSFSVDKGGGTLTRINATTDATGLASTNLVIGQSGANVVRAEIFSSTVAGQGPPFLTGTQAPIKGSPVIFNETGTGRVGVAYRIRPFSGDGQAAVAGSKLPQPLVVKVTDANDNPMQGTNVTFAVSTVPGSTLSTPTAGFPGMTLGVTLSTTVVTTNAQGLAQTAYTLSPSAGSNIVTASANGLLGSPVSFTEVGVAGPAYQLVALSGSGQVGTAGSALGAPFVASVLDFNGNPVSGSAVTFNVNTGGGFLVPSGLASVAVTTDAAGRAQTTLALGRSAGSNSVTAVAPGLAGSPLTFSATGLPGTPYPFIALTPTAGAQGTVVQCSGLSFTPNTTVQVLWGQECLGIVLALPTTDANGSFTANITIPGLSEATTPAVVIAVDGSTGLEAEADFGLVLASGPPNWVARSPLPTPRAALAAATGRDGKIYAIGGSGFDRVTGSVLNVVEAYVAATNTWTTTNPMPTARSNFAAVLGPDGRIYAIGGRDGLNADLNLLEAFDPSTGSWTRLSPMPTARSSIAAVVGSFPIPVIPPALPIQPPAVPPLEGAIYVVGGSNGGTPVGTVEAYVPNQDTWFILPPLPTARSGVGVARIDSTIYAIGGATSAGDSAVVEAYDPLTNAWSARAPMRTARRDIAAIAAPDGRIYAVGGSVNAVPVRTVEAYTPGPDSWTYVTPLLGERAGEALAIGPDDRLYAIGGRPQFAPTTNTVEAYGPSLALSTTTGAAGTVVSVAGAGFAPLSNVTLYWGDPATGRVVGTTTTDFSGNLAAVNATVPPARGAAITAVEQRSQYPARAPFTVTHASAPSSWASIAAKPTAGSGFAAACGADGRLYTFGGQNAGLGFLNVVEVYDPVAAAWTTAAAMPTARSLAAATNGPDGRIYVIGGVNASGVRSTVEAYDPRTNTWSPIASLNAARRGAGAALGADGRIYAIAGSGGSQSITSVEAYDVHTNVWTVVASLSAAREGFATATDADGRIYAIGGTNQFAEVSLGECYDAVQNAWHRIADLPTARAHLTGALGLDGRIYAIGGDAAGILYPNVDAYDPATDTWEPIAPLIAARSGHATAVSPAGQLHVFGGDVPAETGASEAYGPVITVVPASGPAGTVVSVTGANFAANATVQVYWGDPRTGTLLGTGTTDVAGNIVAPVSVTIPPFADRRLSVVDLQGVYPVSSFALALATGPPSWLATPPMPTPRSALGAATGSDGRIYAVGGSRAGGILGTVESFDPRTNAWTNLMPLPTPRYGLATATGSDCRIYAIGGFNGLALGVVEAYDRSVNLWTTVASISTARQHLAAVTGRDRKIYAIGGSQGGIFQSAVESYDARFNTWVVLAGMLTPRDALGAAVGLDGRIYAIGGRSAAGNATATVEVYSPDTNSWATVASMPTPRAFLTALAGTDGRIYAIGGADALGNPLGVVEAYSPSTNTWTAVSGVTARQALAGTVGIDGAMYALGGRAAVDLATVERYGARATLAPTSGAAGTAVTVTGTGFAASATVQVYWGTPGAGGVLVGTGVTTAGGAISGSIPFNVPAGATTGIYDVTIVDLKSLDAVIAKFTVP